MSVFLTKQKALIAFLILAGLSACNKPSYPTGKIEESVLKLCKDEYKLDDVKIKILGSTLGVYIPVEGLIDPDLKLNEKAGKKIEEARSLVSSLVGLSDAKISLWPLWLKNLPADAAKINIVVN